MVFSERDLNKLFSIFLIAYKMSDLDTPMILTDEIEELEKEWE